MYVRINSTEASENIKVWSQLTSYRRVVLQSYMLISWGLLTN